MNTTITELTIQRLQANQSGFAEALTKAIEVPSEHHDEVELTVKRIIVNVRQEGDAALLKYTQQFDRRPQATMAQLEVSRADMQAAKDSLPVALREALETAAQRIRTYHQHQVAQSWQYEDADGTVLGQKITPLDRVGLYVPGGKAAYPSSVLMNAIPAKVAGVAEVVMVVPTPDGERNPLVLAAALIAGVDRVFTMGGAQAVAALAYGTQTVPKVDKIVGPGNQYVAAAKRQVFGVVGIDMIAGPSEILILADGTTPPDWVAMDMFSQAEHDEMAQAILITTSPSYADAVVESIHRLLPAQPRAEIIAQSLQKRGLIVEVSNMQEACEISNRIAPEHLEVSAENAEDWLPHLKHAGAIFLGPYTSESLGDYCAGPNHVLPTSSTARFSSPLGVYDFQKRSSIIKVSQQGANRLGPIADTLATGEGLHAHAMAARLRVES